MRRLKMPIWVFACVCLLTLQFSGLHVHVDDQGFVGGPETAATHSHGNSHGKSHGKSHGNSHGTSHDATHADSHGHSRGHGHGDSHSQSDEHDHGNEYEDARDVSFFDLSLKPDTVELATPLAESLFTVAPLTPALQGTKVAYPVLSGRHTRWRPPLRAPPQSA